jgi:hypothetical protein
LVFDWLVSCGCVDLATGGVEMVGAADALATHPFSLASRHDMVCVIGRQPGEIA